MPARSKPKRKSGEEIVLTRTFDAPLEAVWRAWTEPAQMRRWWGPKGYTAPTCKIDFRVGGRYLYCMRSPEGKDIWGTGVYREIVPRKRFVCTDSFADEKGNVVPATQYGMSAKFPLEMLITVTFEERSGKTRLTLKHAGLPTGEDRQGARQGWSESLDKLVDALADSQSRSGSTLRVARVFDASPQELWSFWTDPAKFARWFNPAPGLDLVVHEFDVRPGGRVRFDMPQPDGNRNPQDGVFHHIEPYRRLVSGAPDKSFLVEVTFEPVGKRTRMTVTVTGLPSEVLEGATVGWNAGFDKLTAALAGQGRPASGTPRGRGFTIVRTLKAPPRKVWGMWTTKAGLEKWFTAEGWTSRVTDLNVRVGGRYEITMSDGKQTIRNHGTYTEVTPPRRLAWTWEYDIFLGPDDEPYDVAITVAFEKVPGGTKMTFAQGPLATAEYTEGSRQGVLSNFERLAKALEY